MLPGIDRLKMLRVRDVMSRNVIEVSSSLTMPNAAEAFSQGDVCSAPVVDEQGHCIGMLSAADFIKRERPRSSELVSSYMSASPRSVVPEESLLYAARIMLKEHIHHLPVLEDGRPVGVVSTMDIVAVLINTVNEAEVQLTSRHR